MQTRREMLAKMGGAAGVAGMIGAGFFSPLLNGEAMASAKPNLKAGFPYEYAKLDLDEVAERAYWATYEGHCMYGVIAPIAEMLAEKVGGPWKSFPVDMFRYGAAGVMHWGTLCGAVNGAAATMYLVSKDPVPLIDEVYNWYSQSSLPVYQPVKPKNPNFKIISTVSGSPLCHVSTTKWCNESGHKFFTPERGDRCCRLVADTARKTAELLNAQLAGSFKPQYAIPAAVQECRSCHGKGGMLENTNTKMDCTQCHDVEPDHGK
ncbi:Putative redox-active protein (C_GCAxxG_C_C) [Malonomonas rubra DSM 5091]|uniref:Putative redox-active protein (C_GCAxxG_C_C) n=1 Tax=Malonomonas rubra DSM 5091 TaxID=1122189 RepID=A0A1M6NRJ6_MALRU|nr:C-GCAxxG-C-C family protein [Malonomonas rubra]SHJ98324.1 Putative redox-active protein (C_GCAxxG_C_C) [Malonomonas rubra DSM 5091]